MVPGLLGKRCCACVQIVGQTADLVDLQRILQRSKNRLNNSQQQNITVGSFSAVLLLSATPATCVPWHFRCVSTMSAALHLLRLARPIYIQIVLNGVLHAEDGSVRGMQPAEKV